MPTLTLTELQTKYTDLLKLAEDLSFASMEMNERDGKLVIKAQAPFQMEKDLFWDKLKAFPNWQQEVVADITVKAADVYGYYTVQPGDTLSKIAERFLGGAKRYMEIFNLNKDLLKDPNVIQPGQRLKMPKKG